MSGIKKTVITVLGLFALLLVILFGSLVYITHYKVDTVDTQESPDGVYELKLQSVGDPYFPFGDAPGQLVLSEEDSVISKTSFEIANDGARFTEDSWSITWYDSYVEVVLSGKDQFDERFRLKVKRLTLILEEIMSIGTSTARKQQLMQKMKLSRSYP